MTFVMICKMHGYLSNDNVVYSTSVEEKSLVLSFRKNIRVYLFVCCMYTSGKGEERDLNCDSKGWSALPGYHDDEIVFGRLK